MRAEAEGRGLGADSTWQQLQPGPRSRGKWGTRGTLLTGDGETAPNTPLLTCRYSASRSLFSISKAKQHKKNPLQELINDSCWSLGKPRFAEVQSRNNKYLARRRQAARAWQCMARNAGSIAHIALPDTTRGRGERHRRATPSRTVTSWLMDQPRKKYNPTMNKWGAEAWEKHTTAANLTGLGPC